MNWRPLPYGILKVSATFQETVTTIAAHSRGSLISGLRTPEKNDALPASVENSLHQVGLAVDYEFHSNADRDHFVKMCLDAGFQTSPKNLACHVEFDIKWWLSENLHRLRKGVSV